MIFTSTSQIAALLRGEETMEEGNLDGSNTLPIYCEDPNSQKRTWSPVITDGLNYVIKPDLTFTALVDQVNEGPSSGRSCSRASRHRGASDDLYENLFEDIDPLFKS